MVGNRPLVRVAQFLPDCAQTDELPGVPLIVQYDPHRLTGPWNFFPKPAPVSAPPAQTLNLEVLVKEKKDKETILTAFT